jgi:hypothetical protein
MSAAQAHPASLVGHTAAWAGASSPAGSNRMIVPDHWSVT